MINGFFNLKVSPVQGNFSWNIPDFKKGQILPLAQQVDIKKA